MTPDEFLRIAGDGVEPKGEEDQELELVHDRIEAVWKHERCVGRMFEAATAEAIERLPPAIRERVEDVAMSAQQLMGAMDALRATANAFITAKTGQPQSEADLRTLPVPIIEREFEAGLECTICMNARPNVVIQRSCAKEPKHCDGHVCKCSATMCLDCFYTYYWGASGQCKKSFARCPTCKAEFCMRDVCKVVPPKTGNATKRKGSPSKGGAEEKKSK
jgi:hypothetical protein